jgi:hypothetical protein
MEQLWEKKLREAGRESEAARDNTTDLDMIRLNYTVPETGESSSLSLKDVLAGHGPDSMREVAEQILNEYKTHENAARSNFNRAPVRLTAEDLAALEVSIKSAALPKTNGPFFGESTQDAETAENDMKFVAVAKTLVLSGMSVYYCGDW